MPSPIAHSAVGYLLYRAFGLRLPASGPRGVRMLPPLLLLAVGLSLLPDVDAAVGVLAGSLSRFHNNATHSIAATLAVALAAGAAASVTRRGPFSTWFWFALAGYGLHVAMDLFTVGKGVMLLWPFTEQRFSSPVPLFYGLHWSDGWISIRHLWTALSEGAFFAVAVAAAGLVTRLRPTVR